MVNSSRAILIHFYQSYTAWIDVFFVVKHRPGLGLERGDDCLFDFKLMFFLSSHLSFLWSYGGHYISWSTMSHLQFLLAPHAQTRICDIPKKKKKKKRIKKIKENKVFYSFYSTVFCYHLRQLTYLKAIGSCNISTMQ